MFSGLLNLRGSDIEFNPVFFSWLVIKSNGEVHFFVDSSKVTPAIRQHLNLDADVEMRENGSSVSNNNILAILHPYDEIDRFLNTEVFYHPWTFSLLVSKHSRCFIATDPAATKENLDQWKERLLFH